MRGDDKQQLGVFSYVSAEQRVPADHPLRAIRTMVDEALAGLSGHFDTLYAVSGRRSIAPEKLVRALLLQALYSVRSERQLMEQMDYNLLFRWFVGLNMDDAIWDVTVFTKNRERLIKGEVAERLLLAVVEQAHARRLLSEEHFTVDGTLIQAWANRRSFREKQDPPDKGTGARGRKLLRDTHESSTDPDARLYRKSSSAAIVPSYLGHVLTENRNGLVVAALATQAGAAAEREAALRMIDQQPGRARLTDAITLGADKSYHHEQPDRGRTQPSRLRDQPEQAQAGGKGLRLGQAGPRPAAGQTARPPARRLARPTCRHRIQPAQDAKTAGNSVRSGGEVSLKGRNDGLQRQNETQHHLSFTQNSRSGTP